MRTEEIEILLRSPLNDPDMVKRAESVLKKRGSRRSDATAAAMDSLPLTCYFDQGYYSDQNPDVMAAGLHPYLHFLMHGVTEGRNPHPLIDLAYIRSNLSTSEQAPLTVQALADALGRNQVRPHPYFDSDHYLSANPDVGACGMAALRHYIRYGAAEGRLPHPRYDHERYAATVPDAPSGHYDAFLHCIALDPSAGGLPGKAEGPKSVSSLADVAFVVGAGSPPLGVGMLAGVQGWVDHVVDGIAYGWAQDPQEPSSRIEVEILEGPRVVGRGTASVHRGDLQQAGYGDGRCAFAIKLSNLLRDGSSHVLTARVIDSPGTPLNGEVVYHATADAPRFDILPSWEATRLCAEWSEDWEDRQQARTFVSAIQRCTLLLETDEGRKALEELQGIAHQYGGFELLDIKIGEAHLAMGAPELALLSYTRALEGVDLQDWALLGVGNCYLLLGRWDEANDCYKRGLAVSPGSTQHAVRLRELEDRAVSLSAKRLINAGDTESALHALMPAFVSRPDDLRLKDLICEVLDAREGTAVNVEKIELDAETMRSKRSVDLLRKVLAHFSGTEGART